MSLVQCEFWEGLALKDGEMKNDYVHELVKIVINEMDWDDFSAFNEGQIPHIGESNGIGMKGKQKGRDLTSNYVEWEN